MFQYRDPAQIEFNGFASANISQKYRRTFDFFMKAGDVFLINSLSIEITVFFINYFKNHKLLKNL